MNRILLSKSDLITICRTDRSRESTLSAERWHLFYKQNLHTATSHINSSVGAGPRDTWKLLALRFNAFCSFSMFVKLSPRTTRRIHRWHFNVDSFIERFFGVRMLRSSTTWEIFGGQKSTCKIVVLKSIVFYSNRPTLIDVSARFRYSNCGIISSRFI